MAPISIQKNRKWKQIYHNKTFQYTSLSQNASPLRLKSETKWTTPFYQSRIKTNILNSCFQHQSKKMITNHQSRTNEKNQQYWKLNLNYICSKPKQKSLASKQMIFNANTTSINTWFTSLKIDLGPKTQSTM